MPRMQKTAKIQVQGTPVTLLQKGHAEFVSLTDIARHKDPAHTDAVIQNWMRNRNSIELLGLWEILHNPQFKPLEFEGFRKQAGLNSFVMTPKRWVNSTHAIGIFAKSGRYGGTFAHLDIALEFASWVSIEFKIYILKEFQRLKNEENERLKANWDLQRLLSKVNYHIQTDAIKEILIPSQLSKKHLAIIYASEADLLNVALFGMTAKQWRDVNPEKNGNLRDHATIEQLVVLSNMESINALLIHQGLPQGVRLHQLNQTAIQQMKSLISHRAFDKTRLA